MGRYENTLKYVQLRKLVEEKKYDKALEMAENMVEDKVRDVSELKLIADVFKKNEKYDKAKELYYIIYGEFSTRRILYNLIVLCVKCNSLEEAESLYQDYLVRDKISADMYILRYRIDRAAGAERSVIIKDLEAINQEDYMEEWAYELAKQYHKAGMVKKCVDECSKIILWFSGGEIAEKAKLLKMHYEGEMSNDIMSELQASIGSDISRYMNDDETAELVDTNSNDETKDIRETDVEEAKPEEEPDEQPDEAVESSMAAERLEADRYAVRNSKIGLFGKLFSHTGSNKMLENAAGEATELKNKLKQQDKSDEKEVEDVEIEEDVNLNEEVNVKKNVSAYAADIPYIHIKELFKCFDNNLKCPLNFAIAVSDPSYAVALVRKITKELQNHGYIENSKIAKIDSDKLNTLNLDDQINYLIGSCIMIENASKMNGRTINSIIKVIDAYPDKIVILLIDEEENLSKMLFKEEVLKNQVKFFITSQS